jgi:hypothetical protein
MNPHSLGLGIVLLTSIFALGQADLNPVSEEAPTIEHKGDSVFVEGHWVSLERSNPIAGPSVSNISCYRKTCAEESATFIVTNDSAYQRYQTQHHEKRAFVQLNTRKQTTYWSWRHNNPDNK